MKKVNFLFGIHNHQPIGNFDFVFEEAYQKSYLPFIDVLRDHPKIRISLHFTGILLDWIEKNHPELIDKVKKLVDTDQVEMLTGGYYEPIMSVIPDKDRIGQIRKLSDRVHKLFGYKARGMWLAERVWEPTLPTSLQQAGIEYTFIDDTHFKYAGLSDNKLNGIYLTENLGSTLKLFPISKRLRYTIPFEDPQATLDHLKAQATTEADNVVVFADDGEKFGVWPNTYDHVYKHGWLDRFFGAIEDNLDWITIMHFSEAADKIETIGNIYLPTASYAEMMHWSLFPDAFKKYEDFEHYLQDQQQFDKYGIFVRGGFWRNFMAKYPEVNDMHKKMLRVSNKLWKLPESKQNELKEAFDHLWAAQCNCPYWHGVFGGIYLSHIRDAIYSNLIEAEKIIDTVDGTPFPRFSVEDVNVDSFDELVVETEKIHAYFSLKNGGTIYELDFKPLNKNILDTMTRRKEGYHEKLALASDQAGGDTASIHDLVLAKEPGLLSKLFYDKYDRNSLVDHFITQDTSLKQFASSDYQESADFCDKPYQMIKQNRTDKYVEISLGRESQLNSSKVKLTKTIRFVNKNSEIEAMYNLENLHGKPFDTKFGVEFNFGLQAGHAHDRYYYVNNGQLSDAYLDSKEALDDISFIGLKDEWRKLDIQLQSDKKGSIWRFPIETISLSEGGFERVYQNSAVFMNWNINLAKEWSVKIVLKLGVIN